MGKKVFLHFFTFTKFTFPEKNKIKIQCGVVLQIESHCVTPRR